MKTSNLIIAGFAITLLVYLVFVFALWDLNPGNWSQHQRSGLIVTWFFSILLGGLVAGYMYDRED